MGIVKSMLLTFLNPILHFWIVAGVAFLLYRKNKTKSAKWLGGYAVIWLILVSVSPLPKIITINAERQFSLLEPDKLGASDSAIYIIVLGGGHTSDQGLTFDKQLSMNAVGRLMEGLRLTNLYSNSTLVCSGGTAEGYISQAELLAETANSLGIHPERILKSPAPKNTKQEAQILADMLPAEAQLLLVTDALHMHRALFWFQYFGRNPVPSPTNFSVKLSPDQSIYSIQPSLRNMMLAERLFYEGLGLLYAKIATYNW